MRKRIHLKKRRKFSKRGIFFGTIFFFFFVLFLLFHWLGKVVNPLLLNYAQIETKRFASYIITDAVSEKLTDLLKEEELFEIIKSETGEIQSVDFNSGVVNQVLKLATDSVYESLKLVEDGNLEELELPVSFDRIDKQNGAIVFLVPMGVITGNSLLMNLGPSVPIRLGFVGDVSGNIHTNIKEYGINNALIEVSLTIEVTEQMTMPLVTKRVLLSTDIPIAMKMVQGKIPTYYQNGMNSDSKIFSIPLE